MDTSNAQTLVWIGYTTKYRTGGAALERAAQDMRRRLERDGVAARCVAVERKSAFVDEMRRLERDGKRLKALHLLSHSGMYGPMFGTTEWPEQFSPHEWRELRIPFAPDGEAYFHACRTARWFAPFFARTFQVPASGFYWYTTFSGSPERFSFPRWKDPQAQVWLVGFPGMTSHGWLASLKKYAGFAPAEPLQRFTPEQVDRSYDHVADKYDAVFDDITVRREEVNWLEARLPEDKPRVLDLGCGNGALLQRWRDRIGPSVGVDVSEAMLQRARHRTAGVDHVRFERVSGPSLPLEDASVDVAVSMLSFRYLDWDPLMDELRRVLTPQGRLLLVDMAARRPRWAEWPRVVRDHLRSRLRGDRLYQRRLKALVGDPAWREMLRHNPMRAEHEYLWYLQSRFPGQAVDFLNIGTTARIIAFDSGPMEAMRQVSLSWP